MNLRQLPIEIILSIFDLLSLPEAMNLARTSKTFFNYYTDCAILVNKLRETFRIDFDYHKERILHEPSENDWSKVYSRLDKCECGFRGLVLDPATADFQPYPFELVVHESKQKPSKESDTASGILFECTGTQDSGNAILFDFSGFARWRTLRDSLTQVTKATNSGSRNRC